MFEQAAGSAFGTFRTCRDFQIEFSGVKRKLDLGFAMGRLWREAVIGSVAYQNASVLPAEERLSPQEQYRNPTRGSRIHLPMEPALRLANPDAGRR